MAVEVDPGIAEQFVERVRFWAGNFEAFIGQHPELTTLPPAAAGGWSLAVAAGAYFLGAISGTPSNLNQRRFLEWLPGALDLLRQPGLPRAQAANLVESIRFWTTVAEREWGGPPAPDLASIVPSPSTVQTATGPALANALARLIVWQKAHHSRIHLPLTVAESQESAALHPFAAAVAGLGADTASGFKAVVGHLLPELRRQLVVLVQEERQLRRAADVELRDDLRERAQQLAQRIGDVVWWLRTEALPDLATQVKTERGARQEADRDLRVRLAQAEDAQTSELAQLATQVAPLVAWAGSFGVHTTTKVKNNEEAIDRLGQTNLSQLLALTTVPGLAALVGFILAKVGMRIPGVLGALEDSASDALGAIS